MTKIDAIIPKTANPQKSAEIASGESSLDSLLIRRESGLADAI
jgi:hypothetical protein